MYAKNSWLDYVTAVLVSLILTGCGGGGSGSSQPSNPSNNLDVQGIWSSKTPTASTSTIILPDLSLWTVINDGPVLRLVTAKLTLHGTTVSGEGKSYILGVGGSTTSTVAVSRNFSTAITEDIAIGAQKSSYLQTYQSRYESPATLGDFAKSWAAIVGIGKITWTVTTTGTITGTNSTGCTFTGQLTERTEHKAVLDVAFTETCVDTVTPMKGIATLSVDKTQWNLVTTTSDETNALILSLTAVTP